MRYKNALRIKIELEVEEVYDTMEDVEVLFLGLISKDLVKAQCPGNYMIRLQLDFLVIANISEM